MRSQWSTLNSSILLAFQKRIKFPSRGGVPKGVVLPIHLYYACMYRQYT